MFRRVLLALSISVAVFAAENKTTGRRWWSYVEYLASDRLEGRLTGSEGHRKAAEYVAEEFRRAGLEPAGTSGYIQPVKFLSRTIVEKDSSLALVRDGDGNVKPLTLGEDAVVSLRIAPAESLEAPMAFVGYGLTVPEFGYDDLAGVDLQGKLAVYLYGGPKSIPGPLRAHYQSVEERWKALKRAGAQGVVVIFNPRNMDIPWARIAVLRSQPAMSLADPALDETPGQKLALTINPAHAEKLFAGSGHSFQEIVKLADEDKTLPKFPLPASIRARVRFDQEEVESQNVAGLFPGSDLQLKDEIVVLSAHLDHLGVGEPIRGDRIYNGAMDNASGVATLLDVADTLHESGKKPRRTVLFLVVTGEEKGLLGSRYFVAHPTVKRQAIIGNLNVDMFLPIFPLRVLTVLGLKESDLGPLVRSVAEPLGIEVQDDPAPERNVFIRSDQYNFIKAGVPAIYFYVGYHKGSPEDVIHKKWLTERYHAPSDDTKQPVNLQAAADYNRIVLGVLDAMAGRRERPRWNSESFFRRYADSAGSQ